MRFGTASIDAQNRRARQRAAHVRSKLLAGMTLLEVLVAAAILSVAAVAALELLASTDAVAREARRHAIASVEAERALAIAADEVRQTGRLSSGVSMRQTFTPDDGGESLVGCTLEIRVERANAAFRTGDDQRVGGSSEASMLRIIAEVVDEHGHVITVVERPAPVQATALTGVVRAGASNEVSSSEFSRGSSR